MSLRLYFPLVFTVVFEWFLVGHLRSLMGPYATLILATVISLMIGLSALYYAYQNKGSQHPERDRKSTIFQRVFPLFMAIGILLYEG